MTPSSRHLKIGAAAAAAVLSAVAVPAAGDPALAGPTVRAAGTMAAGTPDGCLIPVRSGYLGSASAVSTNDVWAVGVVNDVNMSENWNGTRWVGNPLPALPAGTTSSQVTSISARTSSDVWAVGSYVQSGRDGHHTLVDHWDGQTWSQVPTPNAFPRVETDLLSVDASTADDAWAVGTRYVPAIGYDVPFALHWDGSVWSVAKTPSDGIGIHSQLRQLAAVTAISPTDAWISGQYRTGDGVLGTLIEHWDGTTWTVEKPVALDGSSWLAGIASAGAGDIIAVGARPNAHARTLVEQGDGTNWSHVSSPSPGRQAYLVAVDSDSASDAWAVGFTGLTGSGGLVEHWDGSRWRLVDAPSAGDYGSLSGVAALGPHDVWAVGHYGFDHGRSQLPDLEHWNGTAWKRYPASPCGL